jgi:L-ascorbate metabolism protein UlaG (beta-lactamase superfamily)
MRSLQSILRCAVLFLLSICVSAAELKITYLANEGVLLACGDDKVLIDALLRDSLDDYARHPPEVQQKLETGQPPFDGVVLVLATHFHLDHWDAGAISHFLRNNPNALFASTRQATEMMPWSQRAQVRALWPGAGKSEEVQRGHLKLHAFRLSHGKTQNLAYRVSICGREVYHLGDAEGSPEDLAVLHTMGAPDIVLVPFWWLLSKPSENFLRNDWKPRQIVAMHFGGSDTKEAEKVRQAWPKVWVWQTQGESRSF